MSTVIQLAGGIGLFLLGMILLTDGLKAFAGETLRRTLVRFTGTPFKAFASGTAVTLMVQSSSATTVTLIGFVSAGLLTFPQSLGVIFGASLGTTGTGWIVSVLGLKISLGTYALPFVAIGALANLLGRGKIKPLGFSVAGFGLIFIGIDTMQSSMAGLSGIFNLADLPSGGLWGHILAMLIGIILTVLMQSSSAAVATTLTALHAGAVNFEQAASLVIGAAIGTTVTAVLAAIGASVPAKRTALAHVLFNLATGLIAVILLPLFMILIREAQEHFGLDAGATSLAAFHTLFIALGVAVFLPFVHQYARLLEWILPDHGPTLTRYLDKSLLQTPVVALEATRRALSDTAITLFDTLREGLADPAYMGDLSHREVEKALEQIQAFLGGVPSLNPHEPLSQTRVGQMHAVDHLSRLHVSLRPPSGVRRMLREPRLKPALDATLAILTQASEGLKGSGPEAWQAKLEENASSLAEQRRQDRPLILEQTARGEWNPPQALELLDAMRWLDQTAYHTWRITRYLAENGEMRLDL